MKKLFVSALLALFVVGCGGFKVVVKEDAFKGAKVITLDAYHKVIESKFDNTRVVYTKEVKNNKISDPEVSFEFRVIVNPYWTKYNGEDLEEKVQLLIDGKPFEVKLLDRKNQAMKHTSAEASQDFVNKDRVNVTVSTTHFNNLSGKIKLTPQLIQALKNATEYKMRLYAGQPVTLLATEKQLEAVKIFLNTDGSQPQQ